MATQEAGAPQASPSELEIKELPSKDDMAAMKHDKLYVLRSKLKTKEAQDLVAQYEHRAFAREYVEDSPVVGTIGMIGAIPGYQAAKALGLTGSRSGASVGQAVEAAKGVGEGIVNAIKKPWERMWNDPNVPTQEEPKSKGTRPWERDWRVPKAFKTDKDIKAAVALSPTEQAVEDAKEQSPENIALLKKEIASTSDPKKKKILQDTLKGLINAAKR